jgi:hypothetical protein
MNIIAADAGIRPNTPIQLCIIFIAGLIWVNGAFLQLALR